MKQDYIDAHERTSSAHQQGPHEEVKVQYSDELYKSHSCSLDFSAAIQQNLTYKYRTTWFHLRSSVEVYVWPKMVHVQARRSGTEECLFNNWRIDTPKLASQRKRHFR